MLASSSRFSPSRASWLLRGATLAVWLLVGSSLVFWGLRLLPAPGGNAPVPAPTPLSQPHAQAMAPLLGVAAAVPDRPTAHTLQAPRVTLLGVMAGHATNTGVALLAIDGKPPKPVRVGTELEPGMVVQSVHPREVRLGPSAEGPSTLTLTVPAAPGSVVR